MNNWEDNNDSGTAVLSKDRRYPLKKLDDNHFLLPRSYKPTMRVDGLLFLNERLLKQVVNDLSIEQVANVASMPGIVGHSIAMPDIHQGYGAPIGGVAAFREEDGVVSPGAIGYDINCGVRLLRCDITAEEIRPRLKELVNQLYRDIPSGTGSKGRIRLDDRGMNRLLGQGSRWAVEEGYGVPDDLEVTEESGSMKIADPDKVSHHAKQRGRDQAGTLGSGNHFLEVQVVDEVYYPAAAEAMGLHRGKVTLLIHSGSRGLGHQVCTDYVQLMNRVMSRYGISLPDRQLACAPIHSPEGRDYLGAMAAAANFAWANRQCMAHWSREAFARVLGKQYRLHMVYDVAHNIAKWEEHVVDGRPMKLLVHRKGATRSFPAGHPDVPERYRTVGQPVLVPGDMGRYSFVLVGTADAMEQTFGSSCHGAGRLMSRTAAKKGADARDIERQLAERGILLKAASRSGVTEEKSEAYKDVANVVDVVHRAGIARQVVKLRPIGVVKG